MSDYDPDKVISVDMTVREFRSLIKALFNSGFVGNWPEDVPALKLRDELLTRVTFNNGKIET